jgi:hypothetical protein
MRISWLLLVCLAVSGCSQDAKPASAKRDRPDAPERVAAVKIVSIDPEEIEVEDGEVWPTVFTLEYEIGDPESVDSAELIVDAQGAGKIYSEKLRIVKSGDVTFKIAPPHGDLGPTIRFRATCPEGTTEWHRLGEERQDLYDGSSALRIDSIAPNYVNVTGRLASGAEGTGGGLRVKIFGKKLTRDCTVEGQVNGQPIELRGVFGYPGRIEGILYYEDFDDRYVTPRYLEVKVVIKGARDLGTIKRVPFIE